jgi:Cu-processing system permease protein
MKPIWTIAKNTFREIIRDRILYGLCVFALLLFGFSLALGQLSFAEQARITANFGFTAIHLSAIVLAVFVGSTLVGREIDKKTILTLLVRPISRTQFIIGKSIGLIGVIIVSGVLLAVVLGGIMMMLDLHLNLAFVVGFWGVLLEAMVLLGITLVFGSFSTPTLSVSFTLGVFLVGHAIESLKFFANRSENPAFVLLAKFTQTIMPNFEFLNWRSLFVYNDSVPWFQVGAGTVYALVWCVLLVASSALIISRRDLG